jgi:ABC-type lipoprotein export system ATPase subunit
MPEPLPLVAAARIGRRLGTGATATDALRSASCAVERGDRIALVGPSGSGKSTLLHLLGGLDEPSFGRVEWPALGSREGLRPGKIADVFQGPSLLPPLTVVENVRLPVLLGGASEREATARAQVALDAFGLLSLRDKLPEEVSGGQAQRVAIARAIAVRPALILADEPTGQLDSATATVVLGALLDAVAELGAAIVVSTHDPRVAARLDTVWTMADGILTTVRPRPSEAASSGLFASAATGVVPSIR